jgi:hypothetical protein
MKTLTKLFLSLLVISFIGVSIVSAQKPGSTSMQFLEVLPCARATAVGEAYSVWASGAEAVFWNPAGVALVERPEFSITYTKWIFDASLGAISGAISLGNFGAIGGQLQYVDYGPVDESIVGSGFDHAIPYIYGTGSQFKPYSYVLGLTYAKSLTDKFSTGITVKGVHESLYPGHGSFAVVIVNTDSSTTTKVVNTFGNVVLFDFGMRYNTGFRTVQVGAAVQNFGSSIAYASENDKSPAPMLFRVGIAADLLGPNSLLYQMEGQRLGVAMDLFQANDSGQHIHLGLEYEYASIIALRIGYKSNYDAEGFSFGGGVRQKLGGVNFSFDYSFGSTTLVVGNVHRISLGVGL